MTAHMTNPQTKKLREFIDAIERLVEEQKAIGGDVKDKFTEAKNLGFDTKTMKRVIALRRQSKAEREEAAAILDIYCQALGLLGTPLQEYADKHDAELETV